MSSPIKVYEVGGSIRDEFLGLKSKDRDFVVMASSYEEMKDFLLNTGADIFLETPKYFTIRCRYKDIKSADFVLARKESHYSDGRRPDRVEVAETIKQELSRRDFTVNAIAKDIETGEIIDPFKGRADLKNRFLRCVGNTEERFREDSLRMLRAIRFAVTKNLVIGAEINKFIWNEDNVALLKNVSIERIREEMFKCFEFNTFNTLLFLYHFGALEKFLLRDSGLWLKPTLEKNKKTLDS